MRVLGSLGVLVVLSGAALAGPTYWNYTSYEAHVGEDHKVRVYRVSCAGYGNKTTAEVLAYAPEDVVPYRSTPDPREDCDPRTRVLVFEGP